jgi:hypothetical protein
MIKCVKCSFEHLYDLRLFELTGHELNRHGYVTQIFLCLTCVESDLTESDKQLYFKSFDFDNYIETCYLVRGRRKYLQQMEVYLRSVIFCGDDYWREVTGGDH